MVVGGGGTGVCLYMYIHTQPPTTYRHIRGNRITQNRTPFISRNLFDNNDMVIADSYGGNPAVRIVGAHNAGVRVYIGNKFETK